LWCAESDPSALGDNQMMRVFTPLRTWVARRHECVRNQPCARGHRRHLAPLYPGSRHLHALCLSDNGACLELACAHCRCTGPKIEEEGNWRVRSSYLHHLCITYRLHVMHISIERREDLTAAVAPHERKLLATLINPVHRRAPFTRLHGAVIEVPGSSQKSVTKRTQSDGAEERDLERQLLLFGWNWLLVCGHCAPSLNRFDRTQKSKIT